ncbi:MAG: hypothetical protein DDT37_01084 [Firmicutes bacterium]|nr:hypothetical protein [candidate division NPL-UPA2 bacterium]
MTVAARQPGVLAKAFAAGHSPHYVGELSRVLGSHDFLFNAAPALVFTEELLVCMRRDSVLIDITSGAGGLTIRQLRGWGVLPYWPLAYRESLRPRQPGTFWAGFCRAYYRKSSGGEVK